jgi:hypothetical protein
MNDQEKLNAAKSSIEETIKSHVAGNRGTIREVVEICLARDDVQYYLTYSEYPATAHAIINRFIRNEIAFAVMKLTGEMPS